jgi:hypothetical protein
MDQPLVKPEDVNNAASWLGSSIISSNPNQVLIESDDRFIDRFDIHELNRNVDMLWVSQMKVEILKTIMSQECMTLTLAIDIRMIETAIEKSDKETDNDADTKCLFKAIILDGQHRWEAMKQIKQEMPDIRFKTWLIVYIVKNDNEIIQRLETLNKRRCFSQEDNDKVAVVKRFLDAFAQLHTNTFQSRRCIVKVRKSYILKTEKFIQKHRNTTTDQFRSRIQATSELYKPIWENQQSNTALAKIIHSTHLYQLVDSTCQWLLEV